MGHPQILRRPCGGPAEACGDADRGPNHFQKNDSTRLTHFKIMGESIGSQTWARRSCGGRAEALRREASRRPCGGLQRLLTEAQGVSNKKRFAASDAFQDHGAENVFLSFGKALAANQTWATPRSCGGPAEALRRPAEALTEAQPLLENNDSSMQRPLALKLEVPC